MTTRREVGALLKDRREYLGLSQRGLAAIGGYEQRDVSNWERARCQPEFGNFLAWVDSLGLRLVFEDRATGERLFCPVGNSPLDVSRTLCYKRDIAHSKERQ